MLLDIASYARRGPGRRDHLSPADIETIRRTVSRTPEVMVKVLTRGGQNLRAIQAHLAYLNRKGDLNLETDLGEQMRGQGVEKQLLDNWDMELEEDRRRIDLGPRKDRSPPKLVHKVLFSMPPGTPAEKVLTAVKNFAREEFALKHRYAMVLHTDEPHPHVHMIVKAVSEQGVRLHIRKETLRRWRREFARHLRSQGIPANATDRAVRGETNTRKADGVSRAARRGDSTYMQDRVEEAVIDLAKGRVPAEPGKARLMETRRNVEQGWRRVIHLLEDQGQERLAKSVITFVAAMRPPRTDTEALVEQLLEHAKQTRALNVAIGVRPQHIFP
jgi:hypothetical protein